MDRLIDRYIDREREREREREIETETETERERERERERESVKQQASHFVHSTEFFQGATEKGGNFVTIKIFFFGILYVILKSEDIKKSIILLLFEYHNGTLGQAFFDKR